MRIERGGVVDAMRIAPAVAGSAGSLPAIAVSSIAASRTVWVMGPAVSCVWLIGTIPLRETSPTVGFSPTRPFMDDGQLIEPSVSVPMAAAAMPAATAAAEPELDPHAVRSSM